jgi:hypothetical protein
MNILAVSTATTDLIQSGANPLFFFYEDLADVCVRCSDALQVITFVLIFAGLLMQCYKGIMGGDLSGIFRHILVSGIIISIIPYYAEWMLAAQSALGNDLLTTLEVDPLSVLTNFGESFAEAPFETNSAPNIILGIFDPLAWFEYFATAIGLFCMACIAVVMYALFWCGFQIQIIAIYLGSAAAPIFMGMLVFEQTKDTAVKYHIGLLSICFWPLGWGIGMLFTEAMMTSGMGSATVLVTFILGPIGMIPFIGWIIQVGAIIIILLIIIVWLIVVLFAAPKIVSKAITTGAQIGMGLVSAGASTASSVASGGMQAATGAAMMAGGAAITAGTGGAGAAVGVGMMGAGAGSMGSGAGGIGKAVTSAGE